MNDLAHLSRKYYLLFSLPLHVILILSLIFLDIDFYRFLILSFIFYVIVYWIGVQAGAHKLFSHKSWEPRNNIVKYAIATISCFGLMGGPISWARMHRYHHAKSDTDEDPHTPKKGFYISYVGWLLNPPNVPVFIIRDLIKDKQLNTVEQYCRQIVLLFLILVLTIDTTLFVSLLTAMILTFHSEMLVNSLLHKKTDEEYSALNNIWISLISGGSSLHKNHHDNAGMSNFSTRWYEFDLSYQIIRILRK
jgi:fatty-acid desaturase